MPSLSVSDSAVRSDFWSRSEFFCEKGLTFSEFSDILSVVDASALRFCAVCVSPTSEPIAPRVDFPPVFPAVASDTGLSVSEPVIPDSVSLSVFPAAPSEVVSRVLFIFITS